MNTSSFSTNPSSSRIDLVDALRGFALLAIILLHSLEHYNLYYFPETSWGWFNNLNKIVWDTSFFFMAGKAYATFSLLFGFSFYIQYKNEENRGGDFRARFAWRMFLLFLFSQFHSLFYNGDILFLYALVGLTLIPICKLKTKTILIIAFICLLQPIEWFRILYAQFNPSFIGWGNYFLDYAMLAKPPVENGNFFQAMLSHITYGQLYSNLWQIEHGRLFQTGALFMIGLILGRCELFKLSSLNISFWKKTLIITLLLGGPLYWLQTYIPQSTSLPGAKASYEIIFPSLFNFNFMALLVSAFCLLWYYKPHLKAQTFIIPFGRMTLTNYITQSILGATIYYGWGFNLAKTTGATACFVLGLVIFLILWTFSAYWIPRYKQGPLEKLWRKGTWIGHKKS